MAYTPTNSPSQINTVTLAETMTSELEKALVQKSVTGFLGDGGLKAKFVDRGIVVLPDVEMSAMGDYNRDTGFAIGAITIGRTPYQLTQDRGRSFQLDSQDADESGIGGLAGKVMSEFVRTKVVPEMDAYALSKIVGFANARSHVEVLATDITDNTIFSKILEKMTAVQNASNFDEELVCFIDSRVQTALNTSTEFSRSLDVTDFKRGEVSVKVQSYNGMPFIPVPSVRMKSAYTFYDGTTSGQTAGGFVPASGAKNVGFIILPKKAVSLVKKIEKIRIFDPSQNLDMDAWKMDYRLYYDIFARKPYLDTIYALTYTPGS